FTQVYQLDELFDLVQTSQILEDGKSFVDCIPLFPFEQIQVAFDKEKAMPDFSLKAFVSKHFQLPSIIGNGYESNKNLSLPENLAQLWPVLTREPVQENSSIIALPNRYIVPGGRFREIYYWDSYFTMLGLAVQNRVDLIEDMVANFAYLIQTIGHIPNGNRQYYVSRSQPPFFVLMVELLANTKKDEAILLQYLPLLEKEYLFWQNAPSNLEIGNYSNHTVLLANGIKLNRYYDQETIPRQESHAEDKLIATSSSRDQKKVYADLRAGAESGWDFSSRWFANGTDITSIETTQILPVDLNCLIWKMEDALSKWFHQAGNLEKERQYSQLADDRKRAIQTYFWNPELGFFCDYHFKTETNTGKITAAGLYPLYFGLATNDQAKSVCMVTEKKLLQPGGIVTTPIFSGQQWDAPNGWAPLQWMAYKGLDQYGFHELAQTVAKRWLSLNQQIYLITGKMMEKYNVVDLDQLAGGGEYPGQDGFGWTNGVYLALSHEMENC
ncbi:MAG: alpha,alpha-trehalase TreF, partial [Sediminibacterium sp.]